MRPARHVVAALAGAIAVSACGAPAAERAPSEVGGNAASGARDEAATAANRHRVLVDVARVDRRIARRIGLQRQGVELLFPENRAPAELAALFDFDARSSVLLQQRAKAAGDPALLRFVGEELARVEEERDLPRSASAIVRTLSLDLPIDDRHEDDVRAEDQALVATLDRLRETLRDGALGPLQLAELDDSLDLFEKRTTRLPGTPAAIARLRVALTSLASASRESVVPWEKTRARVEVFAGAVPPAAEAARGYAAAHAALAGRLEAVLPKGRNGREEMVSAAAAMLLSSGGGCPDAGLGPEAAAPIERRGMCVLLSALAKGDPIGLVAADLAIDLARWSLAVHRERVDVASAFANKHTAVGIDEVDGAHAFRFALAHPVEAITLGSVAELVARNPEKLAAAWLAKGPMRPDEARAVLGPGLM